MEDKTKNPPQAQSKPNKPDAPYLADIKQEEGEDFYGDYYGLETNVRYPVLLVIAMVIGGLCLGWKMVVAPDIDSPQAHQKRLEELLNREKVQMEMYHRVGIEISPDALRASLFTPLEIEELKMLLAERKTQIEAQKAMEQGK